MMITKEANNGTINYHGAGFDILNYYAEPLNIKYDCLNVNYLTVKPKFKYGSLRI